LYLVQRSFSVGRATEKAYTLWAHKEIGQPYFGWQEGYAAFTVSPTARDGVKQYIENQAAHHRKESFREELVALLKKAGVEYDPKYFE
jgi:putative transposase